MARIGILISAGSALAGALLLSTSVLAQQPAPQSGQPSPEDYQRIIAVLQQQRNTAMDTAALAEAKAAAIAAELARSAEQAKEKEKK